jgi:fission process protein 1
MEGQVAAFSVCGLPSRVRRVAKSSLNMEYELVHSITPLFAAQLTACASTVTAGFVMAAQEPAHAESTSTAEKEFDIYRDSLLRYAGYLNEIGEAFRPLIPSIFVALSYVLALTYVFADGVSKGIASGNLTPDTLGEESNFFNSQLGCTVAGAVDTLSFQFLASIAFPGFIINR